MNIPRELNSIGRTILPESSTMNHKSWSVIGNVGTHGVLVWATGAFAPRFSQGPSGMVAG
jgi:hypothetical protein